MSSANLYRHYRFALVMESTVPAPAGYMTEKIALAFVAGAVPIYFGHRETVASWLNEKAFLFWDVEGLGAGSGRNRKVDSEARRISEERLLERVRYLERNHTAYWEMRDRPIVLEEHREQWEGTLRNLYRGVLGLPVADSRATLSGKTRGELAGQREEEDGRQEMDVNKIGSAQPQEQGNMGKIKLEFSCDSDSVAKGKSH